MTDRSPLGDDIHCHAISRAWHGYAQEPLPEPGDMPGSNGPIVDRVRQRRPKNMMTIIFRQYPARSQSYIGERLQQEGWFDDEGWDASSWFQGRDYRSAGGNPALVIGGGVKWTQRAWETAHAMWERHGLANHLVLTEVEERNKKDQADEFFRRRPLKPNERLQSLRIDDMDRDLQELYKAALFLYEYNSSRSVTNFAHFYHQSLVEAKEAAVTARKLFYQADRLRLTGSPEQALELYERPDALRAWRDKVLRENKTYRQDRNTEEESYEIEANYLDLAYEQYGRQLRDNSASACAADFSRASHAVRCGPGLDTRVAARRRLDTRQPVPRA